jgi:hypothetical protein
MKNKNLFLFFTRFAQLYTHVSCAAVYFFRESLSIKSCHVETVEEKVCNETDTLFRLENLEENSREQAVNRPSYQLPKSKSQIFKFWNHVSKLSGSTTG